MSPFIVYIYENYAIYSPRIAYSSKLIWTGISSCISFAGIQRPENPIVTVWIKYAADQMFVFKIFLFQNYMPVPICCSKLLFLAELSPFLFFFCAGASNKSKFHAILHCFRLKNNKNFHYNCENCSSSLSFYASSCAKSTQYMNIWKFFSTFAKYPN